MHWLHDAQQPHSPGGMYDGPIPMQRAHRGACQQSLIMEGAEAAKPHPTPKASAMVSRRTCLGVPAPWLGALAQLSLCAMNTREARHMRREYGSCAAGSLDHGRRRPGDLRSQQQYSRGREKHFPACHPRGLQTSLPAVLPTGQWQMAVPDGRRRHRAVLLPRPWRLSVAGLCQAARLLCLRLLMCQARPCCVALSRPDQDRPREHRAARGAPGDA